MEQVVYNILKPLNTPLDHIQRPEFVNDSKAVISYHFFNQRGAKYGDGKSVIDSGALQVDLFVKHGNNPNALKTGIKENLINTGFILRDLTESSEYVQGLGEIDQYIFIFEYVESRVRVNGNGN